MKRINGEYIVVENSDIFGFSSKNGKFNQKVMGDLKECSQAGGGNGDIDFATMTPKQIKASQEEEYHAIIVTSDDSKLKIYN